MGFLKTTVLVIGPVFLFGCFSAVRLGRRLPVACRRLGNRMGMTYNYLRLIVKMLAPEEETALKVLSLYNKSNQQMNALSRELSENMFQVKKTLTDTLPEDLKKTPFDNFSLENLKNSMNDVGSTQKPGSEGVHHTGTELIYQGLVEKRKIARKKAQESETEQLTKLS